MPKLRFVVVGCSGEDAAFPASELNEHAANSKGFMTPKSCDYPQELILKLQDGLARITQIQLLSHQSHIASKIELFLSRDATLATATFQRLGYLTLKANVESNYMARELKTVHIDNEAQLLKLVLHQSHINEKNLYNQVGIMAINLCGELLEARTQGDEELRVSQSISGTGEMLLNASSTSSLGGGSGSGVPSGGIGATASGLPASCGAPPSSAEDLSFDLRFDAKTATRIREIHLAKEKAVAMEDYDQAKRLKQMEERLKSIGLQLARLDAQKREAVANEDYDAAKRIKDEITMLEASVGSNESQPIMANVTNKSLEGPLNGRGGGVGPGGGSNTKSRSNFSPRDMYPDENGPRSARSEEQDVGESKPHGLVTPRKSYDRAPRAREEGQDQDDEGDHDRYCHGDFNGTGNEEDGEGHAGINEHFRGLGNEAESLPDPEPLPSALEKESEDMIQVIGMYLTRCFYSNLWNHRDAAIRKVTLSMDEFPGDAALKLSVGCVLVQSGASDRIAQVSLSSLRLFDKLIDLAGSCSMRKEELQRILSNCVVQLINKLGENQSKVREESLHCLNRLAALKSVGVAFVAGQIMKKPKKPLGMKFLAGRLQCLKELVDHFDLVPNSEFVAPTIMSFLEENNAFAHQSRDIRDFARDLTVQMQRVMGADVEPFLKSLRPKQLEEYQNAFGNNNSNNNNLHGSGSQQRLPSDAKDVSSDRGSPVKAKSQPRGARGDRKEAKHDEREEDQAAAAAAREEEEHGDQEEEEEQDEEGDECTCPFCGIRDESFDSERLDQHFWADCRMLTPCKMCGQVIEISGLNDHLLQECEMRSNHKPCPRCGEAITIKFFDKHVSLGDCLPKPRPHQFSRCPLCHDNIPPFKRGWKQHLLETQCPNNPR